MNSESVMLFEAALQRSDDACALSILEKFRVNINSVYFSVVDGVLLPHPLIFRAVWFMREEVVRALVALGGSIDSFRYSGRSGSFTPAGDAILRSNVPALSLCIRFGADLSHVFRQPGSPSKLCSALEMTLHEANHAVLTILLDNMDTPSPDCLSRGELQAFFSVARHGSPAKIIFEILQSRGFDFKALEEVMFIPSDEIHGATSVADAILSFAQKSGAADLVRYLVKDLGLVSSAGRMEGLKNEVDKSYAESSGGDVSPLRADLTKYKCAACETVCATDFCSGCKVPRYCSKECQRRHWKTGGHKQECRIIEQRMHAKEVDKAGSSGGDGSSTS